MVDVKRCETQEAHAQRRQDRARDLGDSIVNCSAHCLRVVGGGGSDRIVPGSLAGAVTILSLFVLVCP
jgi:hypothetical protein